MPADIVPQLAIGGGAVALLLAITIGSWWCSKGPGGRSADEPRPPWDA